MGEKIIRKVKGMSWTAKVSLMLIFRAFALPGLSRITRNMGSVPGFPRFPFTILSILILLFSAWGISEAANQTTVGEVATITAKNYISIRAAYTGDDDADNTLKVEYKLSSEPTIWTTHANLSNSPSPYTTQIAGLTEGTKYDVRITYNDTDDVIGTNPVIIYNVVPSKLMHTSYNLGKTAPTDKWAGKWGTYESGSKYGEFTCGTCHAPRATNIKGVRSTVTAPSSPAVDFPGGAGSSVNFQSFTTSATDMGDDSGNTPRASSTRICEVCHTYDVNQVSGVNAHPYAKSGAALTNHYSADNTDCTSCHKHNVGFKGTGCDTCHGNPPTLSSLGGPNGLANNPGPTGSTTAGSHSKHAITLGYACTTCHTSYAMPETPKQIIDIGFSMWTKDGTGTTYGAADEVNTADDYRGRNETTIVDDNTRKCSNLYCHGYFTGGLSAAPTWGGAALCGTCHGKDATTPPTAGNHTRHAGSGAGGLSVLCTDCHSATAGAQTHVNGDVSWGLNTGSSQFGSDAIYRTGASGSTGATAPSVSYGNCSNIYCHSNVQGASGVGLPTAYDGPTWGGGELDCNTKCHSGTPATGNHTKHTSLPYSYVCSRCHYNAGDEKTNHADHNIDASFNLAFSYAAGSYNGSNSSPGNHQSGQGYGNCSNIYCHSIVQKANGGALIVDTSDYKTVQWGSGAMTCTSCHDNPPATGSHSAHGSTCSNCHTAESVATHSDGTINYSVTYSGNGIPGDSSAYGTCSTTSCHGSGSPTWGANTSNDTCTKCHGTGTVTVTLGNRYVVAPPVNTARNSGTFSDTGQVSDDPKVGAHQTHLRMLNGLSAFETIDVRCTNCHGTLPVAGTHANGSSAPAFQGLATKSGAMSPTYVGTTCTNTYCHNPAGTGGSLLTGNAGIDPTPEWTQAGYIADGPPLKTQTNCNRCHTNPGDTGFEPAGTHTSMTISTDCSGCHGHNGAPGGIAGQQHMDGIKYGGGDCNTCHSYDVVGASYSGGVWSSGTWGNTHKDSPVNEGWGSHVKHINHIKTRLGIGTSLDPTGQTFGTGTPANVCGTCHTNYSVDHSYGGGPRSINFGNGTYKEGGAAGFSFLFDPAAPGTNPPLYNGVSGFSSSVNPKSCSNISCHFKETPVWQWY